MKTLLAILSISLLSFVSVSHAENQTTPYALDYCIFSGDKLGTMGKVTSEVYKNQEIKFCCNVCKKKFDKDPDAGLQKYNDIVKSKSSGSKSSSAAGTAHSMGKMDNM
jgi:hypothetical protein